LIFFSFFLEKDESATVSADPALSQINFALSMRLEKNFALLPARSAVSAKQFLARQYPGLLGRKTTLTHFFLFLFSKFSPLSSQIRSRNRNILIFKLSERLSQN
jgi:hypothetical protein